LEGVAWTGILLMTLNVFISAAYLLVGQGWTRDLPPLTSAAWLIGDGMLGTGLYGLVSQDLSFAFAPSGWLWVTCSCPSCFKMLPTPQHIVRAPNF
jgi:hypothetical protein